MNYDLEAARLKKDWAENPRWKGIKRGYTAEDVVRLRGSVHIEHTLARRGAEKLWKLVNDEPFVNSLGALTGNQAMQQVKAGLKAIYLSGWQVAADANIAGEMYPDQSLYPVNSVPTVVKRINNTFTRADQIQHMEGNGDIDFFAPIVADAEAGFGGVLNAFELMKAMIEAGAAGVHFEDQLASVKKCGHMGGKVLVPTREAVDKLIAARLAADCMGVPTIILARTDAEAADLRDVATSTTTTSRSSPASARSRASTRRATASTRRSSRGLAYAPYADLIWCETGKPDLAFAKAFADAIHAKFPGKMLAYNCSPSFNWKKNLDDATIAKFQRELGAMGYKFQFITLAGFHSLNYSMFNLAHGYAHKQHDRVRRAAGSRVRRGEQGLHRGQAPARSRHRLLRRGHADDPGQPVVDHGAQGLDRGRAVLRQAEVRVARRQRLSAEQLSGRRKAPRGEVPARRLLFRACRRHFAIQRAREPVGAHTRKQVRQVLANPRGCAWSEDL